MGLLILLVLLCPPTAQAEVWPDPSPPKIGKGGENDVALIVAIEDYPDVPDVLGARKNAQAWERYFKDTLGMRDVVTLLDKEAPNFAIEKKLKETSERVRAGGKLWFVFIGHGAPSADGTDGLLVGVKADATADGLYAGSLARKRVLEIVKDSGAPSVLVLDACFSGTYGDSGGAIAKGLQPLLLVKMERAQGQVLLLSAGKADQFAGPLPGDDRPAFSYLLVRGLSGEGDADFNGQITAGEALAFASGTMGRVALGRSQDPQLEPSENTDWLLTPQSDPSLGCALGQTRSEDTAGQCCWPGQSFSKSKNQCVGQPDRCPPGMARLANTCGTCDQGQTLQGDACVQQIVCPAGTTLQNGVCVQAQAQITCPTGFKIVNNKCVEDKVAVTPPPTPKKCPPGMRLEGTVCVSDVPPKNPNPPKSSSTLSTLGWVGLGTGVGVAVAGGVLMGLASSVDGEISSDLTQSEASEKQTERDNYQTGGVIAAGVGGGLLLTGALMLLLDDSPADKKAHTHFNLSIDPDQVVFGLGGRF